MPTRRRAFGNIRQVGKRSWEASYRLDGVRYKAPGTFPAKTDASIWLSTAQADLRRGYWVDPTPGQEPLNSYVEGWLNRRARRWPLQAEES